MSLSMPLFDTLKESRTVAILSPQTPEDCLTAYDLLTPLGISLEIVFRTGAAMEGIERVLRERPGALIMAGTVLAPEQAEKVIRAGVAGVVSADYIPSVVEVCVRKDIMCIPGGLAGVGEQLSQKARILGCSLEALREKVPYQWVHKLFPAVTDTVSFMGLARAWKGPFQGLTLFYTGGISQKNLQACVDQDPQGIFCGTALTQEIRDPQKMKEAAGAWLQVTRGTGEDISGRSLL